MNLKQIEYFVCVAEAGSFTRAAALLRVAQPALSRHVRNLEESLEVRLLVRNGRGVVTTEVGERYLEQCRGILSQVERANEEIALSRGAMVGKATIGMPPTVCGYLGVPLATRFREAFPKMKLTILQGRSSALQEWLASGRIDLALIYNADYLSNVEKTVLQKDNLVLVQPPSETRTDPMPLRELHDFPLIVPSLPNIIRTQIETHLARQGLSLDVAMEIDNIVNLIALVRAGHGYAVLSTRTVRTWEHGRDLALRPIIEPELTMSLSLVVPFRPATRTQKTTIRLIDEVCHGVFEDRGALSLEPVPG